ncbi:MAG: hypothetical protein IJZ29_01270 [Clostridia bacterium]|nr:hypothetical protein [Clostridia bacterium]
MTKLNELKKYLNYEFSTGCYTGDDYKEFERKYISYLKAMCKEYGWELVKANKNHYEFSAFFKDADDNYVYFSISDVRYFQNEWYNHILVRTAKHDKDYSGGQNNYTNLESLPIKLHYLFKGVYNG